MSKTTTWEFFLQAPTLSASSSQIASKSSFTQCSKLMLLFPTCFCSQLVCSTRSSITSTLSRTLSTPALPPSHDHAQRSQQTVPQDIHHHRGNHSLSHPPGCPPFVRTVRWASPVRRSGSQHSCPHRQMAQTHHFTYLTPILYFYTSGYSSFRYYHVSREPRYRTCLNAPPRGQHRLSPATRAGQLS